MTHKLDTRPELFNEDQMNDVLEMGKATLVKEVVEPIEKGIDALRKAAAELQLLPGVDRVIMRIDTLNYLLEEMRKIVGTNKHEDMLRGSGQMIGGSFAEDFIKFLQDNRKLPQSEKVLLELWTKIESNANWGEFILKYDTPNKIVVTLKNSFLTRALNTEKHRNCAFMEGYVLGFLWEVIKEYYYWFSQTITKPAALMLEPIDVVEDSGGGGGDMCTFTIERREKKSENALEMIEKAKEAYRNDNYTQSAAYLRSCVEWGFKEKIDIAIKNPVSLTAIIKAFKKTGVKLRYTIIDDIFAKTSEIIHGSRHLGKEECEKMIKKVNNSIKALDFLKISNHKKKAIEKELSVTK